MPPVIASPAIDAAVVLVLPAQSARVYVGQPMTVAQVEPGTISQTVAAYRYGATAVRAPAAVHTLTIGA